MTRKTAAILIITFFLIIMGALVFSYFRFFQDGSVAGTKKEEGFRGFFPFGDESSNFDSDDIIAPTVNENGEIILPFLRKLTEEPVAGFTTYIVSSSTSTTTPPVHVFRFMLRSTGHIFDVAENSVEIQRVSNTTIPKVMESLFLTKDKVVARFLKDDAETIETFLGDVVYGEDGVPMAFEGVYLAPGIKELAVSPSGNLFYLTKVENGSVGTLLNTKDNKSKIVFRSPLSEWSFAWSGENKLLFYTKPSSGIRGYLYSLGLNNNSLDTILRDVKALTVASGPADFGLYSENADGRTFLRSINFSSKTAGEIPLSTLPEKCVWPGTSIYCASTEAVVSGDLPDSWYQGRTSFRDSIWELYANDSGMRKVVDLSEQAGEDIDAINLQVTEDGEYLLFMNKKDGALWALRLQDTIEQISEETIEDTQPETVSE